MARLSPHMMLLYLLTSVLLTTGRSDVFAQGSPIVNSIEVKGLKRIEESAVKSKIAQKTGEPLSNEKTAEDIKNIFKMGYFSDVTVEIETLEGGIKLIYVVKEKPTIIKVEFQGNKEIEDEKLREKVSVSVGSIADTPLMQDNATKLQLFYEEEGFWLARIVPVVHKIGENEVSLTYQIEEGRKVRIRKIIIEGNKAIPTKKITGVMKTSVWAIYSFITSSGYYKRETVTADVEAIKDLYFNNGYIKATVADPQVKITDDRKGMTVTIQISEGEQYRISDVAITGNKAFSEADLRKNVKTFPGSVFSKATLKADISAITDMYTQRGYALANVYPDVVPDDPTKTVKLIYKVEEGDIYRIGRIEISGNVKTRDKVIRREIRLDEGDLFNSALLKRSYERINNLNFFESVDLAPKPRYEEKLLDMDVKVKEKSTNFISIGGGYSSVDKLIGVVDVTMGNLFGTGRLLKMKGELGGQSSNYLLDYRDPWFMDREIAFDATIYRSWRTYINYDRRSTGFGFGFGKKFGEFWGGNIGYNYEKAKIFNVNLQNASSIVTEQIGTKTTSSITPSLTRDSRDNYLDPTRGSRNSVSFTFAGLGGENAFIKTLGDSAWFFPFWDTTIMLRGRIGYATGIFNKTLPLYERFYVGGIYTVRGLGFGDAGPRDDKGERIGGTKELIFNVENIFPIFPEVKLKGVVFFDAGNSYDLKESFGSLRYTSGFGLRWISPMGPIRVEWGYNIQKKSGEPQSKVEFTFGSFF
ncbi:MAG TPA: outer membrane protein assembly factor BamA [Thermodesulfovibrionales bacterium]|nr:outer membrane protein assembly factor BamA [Thermodesulfovibrionales bacterium]